MSVENKERPNSFCFLFEKVFAPNIRAVVIHNGTQTGPGAAAYCWKPPKSVNGI
jgi:hypothetical protein